MACVDETPQKIVESKLTCFLCGCTLKKERVCIFGKSSVDIQGLIKAAIDVDVTVFSSSEIFICTANCYRRLICFEKISNNLCTLKKEIKKDYDKGGSGVRTKRLRKETTCLEAQMDPAHICYLASRISSRNQFRCWNQCCEIVKVPRSCHLYFRISSKCWKQCCQVAKVPRSYHLYFLFCSSRPCSWISFRR